MQLLNSTVFALFELMRDAHICSAFRALEFFLVEERRAPRVPFSHNIWLKFSWNGREIQYAIASPGSFKKKKRKYALNCFLYIHYF